MKSDSQPWKWSEGPVNRLSDHFEVRYEDESSAGPDEWTPVALVGHSANRAFNVEFLVDRADPTHAAMLKAVEKELNFYLVEKREPNPWNYLQHHCGTVANIYSKVHWSFHPGPPFA